MISGDRVDNEVECARSRLRSVSSSSLAHKNVARHLAMYLHSGGVLGVKEVVHVELMQRRVPLGCASRDNCRVSAKRYAELRSHVAKTTETDDAHLHVGSTTNKHSCEQKKKHKSATHVRAPHAESDERAVRCYARAQQRRRRSEVKIARDLDDKVLVADNGFGISACRHHYQLMTMIHMIHNTRTISRSTALSIILHHVRVLKTTSKAITIQQKRVTQCHTYSCSSIIRPDWTCDAVLLIAQAAVAA